MERSGNSHTQRNPNTENSFLIEATSNPWHLHNYSPLWSLDLLGFVVEDSNWIPRNLPRIWISRTPRFFYKVKKISQVLHELFEIKAILNYKSAHISQNSNNKHCLDEFQLLNHPSRRLVGENFNFM